MRFVGVDVLLEKVNNINDGVSPLKDDYIEKFLSEKKLNLHATTDDSSAVVGADFAIVATPTNYNEQTNYFDTSIVESVIKNRRKNLLIKLKKILLVE